MKPNGKPIVHYKKLIVYDLDMTLVTTDLDFFHKCILKTAAILNAPEPSAQEISDFWYGVVDRTLFIQERLGIEDEMIFWNLYRSFDTPQARVVYTRPFPHVVSTLHSLRQNGKKQAIITASVMPNAQAEIALLSFEFDLVVSVSETPDFKSKPDPQSLFYVMEYFGVSPDDTLFVGDSGEDERLAFNADVDFVHCKKRDPDLDFGRPILSSFDCWSQFPTLQ